MASGVYGLYFYVLLLAAKAGSVIDEAAEEVLTDVMFGLTLAAVLPLALVLLLAMPAGLSWAAFRHSLLGLSGRVVRGGCVASMAFAATYVVLIVLAYALDLTQDGTEFQWWPGWVHVAVLLVGLAVTWRARRWLLRQTVVGYRRRAFRSGQGCR